MRDFSKRLSKVNRVVGNPTGTAFDLSDPEESNCGPEPRNVLSELAKSLSMVTEQLAALRKDVHMLKTQSNNIVTYHQTDIFVKIVLNRTQGSANIFLSIERVCTEEIIVKVRSLIS